MDTRVIETDAEEERWIDSESEGDGWDDGDDESIAPRPRGRLLQPLPLALIALTIAAAGFLGGVLAQKGSEGGGTVAGPGGAGLAALVAAKAGGSEAAGTEGAARSRGEGDSEAGSTEADAAGAAAAGLPSFGGTAGAAATGTVTSVDGRTIYVKESDGTVVAVKAGDGSTVTRDSNVSAQKVHPGDTVIVQGSKHGSTVRASSIAATESGVESTVGFGAATAPEASGKSGKSSSGTSVESLFEE